MRTPLKSAVCILSLTAVMPPAGSLHAQDQCITCHETLEDRNAILFKLDIHRSKGMSCADCHGGNRVKEDMMEAMDPQAGYIGVPKGDAISTRCARCHSDASTMATKYGSTLSTDQMEAIGKSVHGEPSTKGKQRIAQCTSCHGAHGIVSKTDPRSRIHPLNTPATCSECHANAQYMRDYDPAIPVDQMEKYRTSVHGRKNSNGDSKVAECTSCHGSHEILSAKDVKSSVYPMNLPTTCASCHSNAEHMRPYKLSSDQFEKYSQSIHGRALLEKNDLGAPACNDCHGNHGATPPGVESISRVCGTCHALNAELFSMSPHQKAFDARKLPACETCHGYHDVVSATDDLLGVQEGAVCRWCHGKEPESKGYRVARWMRHLIDSLSFLEKNAISRVNDAEQKGMEVSEAKFRLREIRQARLETRTKVHSFDEVEFQNVADHGFGVGTQVIEEANGAIDEYYYRRRGFLVASLVMIVLGVSLFLLIRRIEIAQNSVDQRKGPASSHHDGI